MAAPRYAGDWSRVRRGMGLHRRLIAGLLASAAIVLAVSAAQPRATASVAVWVAARDLPGGAPLVAADLRVARYPAADVPTHALPAALSPVGQLLAAPVRRGEPLTDVRLLSGALSTGGHPGQLAVPVRTSDLPAALALVRAGDRVDVLDGSDPTGGSGPVGPVVEDVRVLAVPTRPSPDGSGLVIVAASPAQAATIAAVPPGVPMTIAVRRGG